jgi:ABC-type enterochelin transport system substrate-binding protein
MVYCHATVRQHDWANCPIDATPTNDQVNVDNQMIHVHAMTNDQLVTLDVATWVDDCLLVRGGVRS